MKHVTLLAVALLVCTVQMTVHTHAAEKVITPIDKLTAEYKGKFVTVQGTIAGARKFKSGMRYVLDDGTGEITLVLFDRELKQVPKRDQLGAGATVNATGKVDFFNQEAQVVPIRGTDVILIAAAPVLTPSAIASLSRDTTALVQGVVTEAANFSAGFKLTLNDGTGQVALTLFENTFDALTDASKVNVGATLRVSGEVDEFRGALEIVPGNVEVIQTKAREVKTYDLAAITGNDHNAVVQVGGEVTSVAPFDNGLDVMVADAGGAQVVRLWNVVMKRVPLKVGDKVTAIGRVKASKKGITIDVAMPSDIQIKK